MRLFTLTTTLFATVTSAATARTLTQFPNPTWLENLIQTRNNSVLLSVIGRAELYLVNPSSPSTPSLVTTFPNANAVFGIAELEPDLYAVGVGSTTPDFQPVPQSYSVWTIDLLPRHLPPKVKKIADLPNVTLINGIAALNPSLLLLADSFSGNVVKLDIKTKKYSVALTDTTLAADFSAPLPLGVNGLRLVGNTLYYSNTVQSLIGRVRVDRWTGKAISNFEVVIKENGIRQPDDFAVGWDGSLYVTSPPSDALWKVKSGKVEVVRQGGDVAGATSAVFGGNGKLYVSTSGLVGGVPSQGGKLVVVDL